MEEKKKINKIIPVILGIIIVLIIGLIVKQVIDFNSNDNLDTNIPSQGNQSDINNSNDEDQPDINDSNDEEQSQTNNSPEDDQSNINHPPEEKQPVTNVLSKEEKLVKRLMSPFKNAFNGVGGAAQNTQFYGYLYKKKSYSVSDISNEAKLYLAIQSLLYDEDGNDIYYDSDYFVQKPYEMGKITIPRDDVSKAMKKIFGNSVQYTDASLNGYACALAAFKYDSINQKYSQPEPGCGGHYFDRSYTKIESSKINKDNIEIIENVIIQNGDLEIINVSTGAIIDHLDMNEYKWDDFCENDNKQGCQSVFDLYPKAISKYKYTFRLENGNYYFEKVELVEDAK